MPTHVHLILFDAAFDVARLRRTVRDMRQLTGRKLADYCDQHMPDLFREGQGIIANGKLNDRGEFVAQEVLAKHDENYMPPEVAHALEKSGYDHKGNAK